MKRGNRPTLLLIVCCFFMTFLMSGCGIAALSGISGIEYEDDVQELAEMELSMPNAISEAALHYGKPLMRYHCISSMSDLIYRIGREGRRSAIDIHWSEWVIHMSSADSNTGLDCENRYIMTGKDVEVRDRPRQSGYVTRTLSYQVVDVGAATYSDEGIWCLVSFFCFDSSQDNMGWVKLTDLMEYTEENYQLLRYPVKVREGCVDLETGEPVEWTEFAVDYVDDYAVVTQEGGRWYNVSPSDIIYPEFYNNSPYNFPTFSDN